MGGQFNRARLWATDLSDGAVAGHDTLEEAAQKSALTTGLFERAGKRR